MNDLDNLILHMRKRGYLKSERVTQAISKIDRMDFVGKGNQNEAYGDYPLQIGFGQTISQPSVVAFMLDKLGVQSSDKVLDIGTGSGWTTALLASLAGPEGQVTGYEKIIELLEFGRKNLAKYNYKNAEIKQATKKLGQPGSAFDRILVSAEADELPAELIEQLKPGGTMVIPVKDAIHVIRKDDSDKVSKEIHRGFRFVPLV